MYKLEWVYFPTISARPGHSAKFIFCRCPFYNPTECSTVIELLQLTKRISKENRGILVCYLEVNSLLQPIIVAFKGAGLLTKLQYSGHTFSIDQ